jgi:hypothetical protein
MAGGSAAKAAVAVRKKLRARRRAGILTSIKICFNLFPKLNPPLIYIVSN